MAASQDGRESVLLRLTKSHSGGRSLIVSALVSWLIPPEGGTTNAGAT
jgi:hypothetical protein